MSGGPYWVRERSRFKSGAATGLDAEWTEYQVVLRGKIISRHEILDDANKEAARLNEVAA